MLEVTACHTAGYWPDSRVQTRQPGTVQTARYRPDSQVQASPGILGQVQDQSWAIRTGTGRTGDRQCRTGPGQCQTEPYRPGWLDTGY